MNPELSREIQTFIARLHIGRPVSLGPVTAVPFFLLPGACDTDADLLGEGISSGRTTVSEVSSGGIVGRVLVHHRGPRPLLLLHGEEVVGAKQNRIFNASFVVAPGVATEVPVSCVESGRWGYATPSFSSSERTITSRIRQSTLDRCTTSLTARGTYDAGQTEVWDEVDDYIERTGVTSRTSSYADAVDPRRAEAEMFAASLAPGEGDVGYAFFCDGFDARDTGGSPGLASGPRLLSLDLFGSPSLFARAFKKIAVGVAADVLTRQHRGGSNVHRQFANLPSTGSVENLLRSVAERPFIRCAGAGGTETLHAAGDPTAAAAVLGGRVFHIFAAQAVADA